MNRNYAALILRDDEEYVVVFPDFPGCQTFAPTVEEAFDNALSALESYMAAMHDEGMPIPDPTPLMSAEPDPEDAGAVVTKVLVPVTMPGKTVRTNISIDESLLALIDSITPNRSAFFTEAARGELARRRRDG